MNDGTMVITYVRNTEVVDTVYSVTHLEGQIFYRLYDIENASFLGDAVPVSFEELGLTGINPREVNNPSSIEISPSELFSGVISINVAAQHPEYGYIYSNTAFEIAGGVLLEKYEPAVWTDYDPYPFNFAYDYGTNSWTWYDGKTALEVFAAPDSSSANMRHLNDGNNNVLHGLESIKRSGPSIPNV